MRAASEHSSSPYAPEYATPPTPKANGTNINSLASFNEFSNGCDDDKDRQKATELFEELKAAETARFRQVALLRLEANPDLLIRRFLRTSR